MIDRARGAESGAASAPLDRRARLVEEILDRQHQMGRLVHGGVPREWLDVEITMPQLKTLLVLYGAGPASMRELADALGAGVSTLTGIVDRLVEHGLVVREEDPRDRRVVVGRLTPEGEALIDRLLIALRDRMSRVLDRLTLDELAVVADACRLLQDAAAEVYQCAPLDSSTAS